MERVNIVALIIYKDGKILAEKRKSTRVDDPGKVIIPSGHVEAGETLEQACKRELKEETDLECDKFRYVTKLPNETKREHQMIHFYACEDWKGKLKSLEAETLFWLGPNELERIDYDIDIKAIAKYFRMREAGNCNQSFIHEVFGFSGN
jgi:8-oxo-dGTP diphosphatase